MKIDSLKKYTIYVLQCSDGTLYTRSSSEDKDSFLKRHNDGMGEPYTKGRLPVKFHWMYEGIDNQWIASSTALAIRRLYHYKKLKLFEGDKNILNEIVTEGIKNGPIREKNYERYLKAIGNG